MAFTLDYLKKAQELFIKAGQLRKELQYLLHVHQIYQELDPVQLRKLPEDLREGALKKWQEARQLQDEAGRLLWK